MNILERSAQRARELGHQAGVFFANFELHRDRRYQQLSQNVALLKQQRARSISTTGSFPTESQQNLTYFESQLNQHPAEKYRIAALAQEQIANNLIASTVSVVSNPDIIGGLKQLFSTYAQRGRRNVWEKAQGQYYTA